MINRKIKLVNSKNGMTNGSWCKKPRTDMGFLFRTDMSINNLIKQSVLVHQQ